MHHELHEVYLITLITTIHEDSHLDSYNPQYDG